jgi:signal transduction histidine kinase
MTTAFSNPMVVFREELHSERAVLSVRRHARYIAELLDCSEADRLRIPALMFSIAHDVYRHTFAGQVEFAVALEPAPRLSVTFSGRGDGMPTWQKLFETQRQESPVEGAGMIGVLLRDFDIETYTDHIAVVTLTKWLSTTLDAQRLQTVAATLADAPAIDDFAEVSLQNQELIELHLELQRRQSELQYLGRELEDTNRGVVALYAEVEDKATRLRQADAMKSRFLSNMSHEFRTPLGSIRALAQLLLDRLDGDLSAEQEKQVQLILGAAGELSELVNDLLDLAKIEAGKVEIRPAVFSVLEMFSALRGMLGPLLNNKDVLLTFDVENGLETLHSDEAKVAQILRNFVSNALKFTKTGHIAVTARYENTNGGIRLAVSDTGIGIASKDLELIFEEFTQIENPLQQRAKGTGLGLPLCRQLANLLNAQLHVESTLGQGATFSLVLPAKWIPRGSSDSGTDERAAGQ